MRFDPFAVVWTCAWPPLFAVIWRRIFRRRIFRRRPDPSRFYESWGCAGLGGVLTYSISREIIPIGISVFQIVLAVVMWWLSRRKRKRAPKLAGAKSRALLAAVVRTMRERSRVRPVLRPVPGRV